MSHRSLFCATKLRQIVHDRTIGRNPNSRESERNSTNTSALPTARASAFNEFRGSITRLWHLLPTLQDWCCHHPCKARFRLAGSPLPGGSRTLRIATKGFRSQSHPPFLDLSWRKGSFILNLPLASHPSITSSASNCNEFGRRDHMARSHNRQLDAPAIKEPVGCDEEGIGSVAQESGEGRLDLAAGAQPAPRARPTPARLGPSRVQPACDHLIAYVRAAFDNRWRRFQNRIEFGYEQHCLGTPNSGRSYARWAHASRSCPRSWMSPSVGSILGEQGQQPADQCRLYARQHRRGA
jgi:hypothetical protein